MGQILETGGNRKMGQILVDGDSIIYLILVIINHTKINNLQEEDKL